MAHHKSALKRIRQTRKRRLYNRQNKRMVKYAVRDVIEASNYEEAMEKFRLATKALDKATARGVMHKNTASRKKSRLYKAVKKLAGASAE